MYTKHDIEIFASTLLAGYMPLNKFTAESEIKYGLHDRKIIEIYEKIKAMKSDHSEEIATETAEKLRSFYRAFGSPL